MISADIVRWTAVKSHSENKELITTEVAYYCLLQENCTH